jgi:23S rRNA (uracil1939-C5)-methyltransferase
MFAALDELRTLRIRTLATGGDAVGHPEPAIDDDAPGTWFVADALPGELVGARALQRARKHIVGTLVDVREPSADRVAPPCTLAGICGGCSWQHVAAGAQLRLKTDMVTAALRELAVTPVAMPVAREVEGLGYRRRARLHYRRVGDALELGFHRQRSHEIVDAPQCPVLVPQLRHAFARLRGAAAHLPASGEVFATTDGRRVILGLPGVRPGSELLRALEACLDRVLVGIELRGGRKAAIVGHARMELDGTSALAAVEVSPFVFVQAQAETARW